MIGIRLADKSVFPILENEQPAAKRLILTTERDHQDRIDVEFVRDARGAQVPIGQLSLADLRDRNGGEHDIELMLRLEPGGVINVSLHDPDSGNTTGRSIAPDHAAPAMLTEDFHEDLDPADAEPPRPRRRVGLLAGLVLLLIAAGAALIWWTMLRPVSDPMAASDPAARRPAQTESSDAAESAQSPAAGESAQTEEPGRAVEPTAPEPPVREPEPGSVAYRIERGDTLWDISETFYGTPWLYPELADANRISNPDMIYADRNLQIPDQLRREQ